MAIQRLSHIGVCVSDLEKSLTFYREVFGYETVAAITIGPEADSLLDLKNTDLDAVYIQRPDEDTRLELLYYRSPGYEVSKKIRATNLTGITHLSFRTDDFKKTVEETQKYGGQFIESSLTEYPQYKMYSGMVTDPDGTRIELLQAPTPANALPGEAIAKKDELSS